jgi:hypothetical protein
MHPLLFWEITSLFVRRSDGTADFAISGLGDAPAVDLYFYFGANGDFDLPGSLPVDFSGGGAFTRNNTRFFKNVPVSGGSVNGKFGKGAVAILNGLTIKKPGRAPFIKSTSPTGNRCRAPMPSRSNCWIT